MKVASKSAELSAMTFAYYFTLFLGIEPRNVAKFALRVRAAKYVIRCMC